MWVQRNTFDRSYNADVLLYDDDVLLYDDDDAVFHEYPRRQQTPRVFVEPVRTSFRRQPGPIHPTCHQTVQRSPLLRSRLRRSVPDALPDASVVRCPCRLWGWQGLVRGR